jgi:hypothetical protein
MRSTGKPRKNRLLNAITVRLVRIIERMNPHLRVRLHHRSNDTAPEFLLSLPEPVFRRDVYPQLDANAKRIADNIVGGDTLRIVCNKVHLATLADDKRAKP